MQHGVGGSESVPTRHYDTMLGTLKHVYTEEGWKALFKGVIPRVLQLGVNHALRFSGYEAAREGVVRNMLMSSSEDHVGSHLDVFGTFVSLFAGTLHLVI